MAAQIVLLSGPPASGKDTVTTLLCERHPRFTAFKKHRGVPPDALPKSTYHDVPLAEFEELERAGAFLQSHERYGRRYGVARAELAACLESGHTPVIHIGRVENYRALTSALAASEETTLRRAECFHVLIWETEDELGRRLLAREGDAAEAVRRGEAVAREFADAAACLHDGERPWTMVLRNTSAQETVRHIFALTRGEMPDDGYGEFGEYLGTLASARTGGLG